MQQPAETRVRPVPGEGYWRQSRRPLSSLAFVAPLLVLYEGGVLLAGPQALRNGADVWLRQLLDGLGLGHYLLLPLLTVGLLLAWHHTTGEPWRVQRRVLLGMALECAALAVCLLLVARLQARLPWLAAGGGLPHEQVGPLARLVLFVGAGIYEEVLFRLLLLSLLSAALQMAGAGLAASRTSAVLVTSLAFSLAHYVGAQGEVLAWSSFVFRFLAGAFFALLFVCRGFGVAVGTHAGYDLLVGLA